MEGAATSRVRKDSAISLSVILPTYNESKNITGMLDAIIKNLPPSTSAEIVVVDDNSPDGTGSIVEQYSINNHLDNSLLSVKLSSRKEKSGLSSAIIHGIKSTTGEIVLVMDSDLSHPPELIPKILHEFEIGRCDLVVASRYVKGGSVTGWPFQRRLMSLGATKIAQKGLGVKVKDPMSGYFAFRRNILADVEFEAIGYKMLLEMLVKIKGITVKELPYTFTNRRLGSSKLDSSTIFDYIRAVWNLYRYGRSAREKEQRTSVRFLSKAARFYTIGLSGLLVNYAISTGFASLIPNFWYLYATIIGIAFSITSNFVLNKAWTFEDREFALKKTLKQYGLFAAFSSLGAAVQLSLVYLLVDIQQMAYPVSLILAVAAASVSNFLLNKKWTFKERVWS